MKSEIENLPFYRVLCEAIENVQAESLSVFTSLESEDDLHNMSIQRLGLDSVQIFELVGNIEDIFSITLSDTQVFECKTLGELRSLCEENGVC
ncbi:acyl carrier protein [Pseudoalteromonas rubra]|uniref:Carrier domain-containing protein n=1 Tax=Pseudoalteromonas rubra TaxID=43658 RepID=A0A0U2PFJ5_9GAMM|nr:acyl carrier protein [Pseudoalteromonas rubra]ALU45821.1 hypothetical protein AT705_23115 [Pseudoalteromonas rubra]